MRTARWIAVTTLSLAMATAAAAQDGAKPPPPAPRAAPAAESAEDAFYRAFYAEQALRDFGKAADAYAEAADRARASDLKDLLAKALAGRGRCLRAQGREADAAAALREALAADPANAEAKAALEEKPAPGPTDPQLEAQLRLVVSNLAATIESPRREAARTLNLLGARALPFLEEGLRSRNLLVAEAAARFLPGFQDEAGTAAVVRALSDPEVLYRDAVAQNALVAAAQSLRPGEEGLLRAALARRSPQVRLRAALRLQGIAEPFAARAELLRAIAADPDPSVRFALLSAPVATDDLPVLRLLAVEALASPDGATVQAALAAVSRSPDLLPGVEERVRQCLGSADPRVRRAAFGLLTERGLLEVREMGAALLDPHSGNSPDAARFLAKVPSPPGWDAETGRQVVAALRARLETRSAGTMEGTDALSALLGCEQARACEGIGAEDLVRIFALAGPRNDSFGSEVVRHAVGILAQRGGADPAGLAALVGSGLERLPPGAARARWVNAWKGLADPAPFLAAAALDEPGTRQNAYEALIAVTQKGGDLRDAVRGRCPHLGEDLAAPGGRRLAALRLLELVPDPAFAPALRAVLSRALSDDERQQAMAAFVRCAGKDSVPVLREDVEAEPSRASLPVSLNGLVEFLGAGAVDDLVALAVRRKNAEWALYSYGRQVYLPDAVMEKFLDRVTPELATNDFLRRIATFPRSRARDLCILRALAGGKATGTLVAAAYVAGSLHLEEASGELGLLLDHQADAVRKAAQAALVELRTYRTLRAELTGPQATARPETLARARGMLRSEDAVLRRAAVLALGALGDAAVVGDLLDLVKDADVGVREAALGALERLGGRPAAPPAEAPARAPAKEEKKDE